MNTPNQIDVPIIPSDPEVGNPGKLDPKLLIRVLWSMLRRRWLPIATCFVFSILVAALSSKPMAEQVWKSTGVLLYTPPSVPDKIGAMKKSVELANMSGFVTSHPVLERVKEEMGLAIHPSLIEKVVTVETSRMTKTVFISMTWGDQTECEEVLSKLFEVYPKYVAEIRQSIASSSLNELNSQIVSVKSRLEAARERYRDFTRKHKIVDFKQDLVILQTKILTMETQRNQMTRDENSLRDQLDMLDKQIKSINEASAAEAEANKEFEAANESLADNRRRQGRLRELISEERRMLEMKALIDVKRREYERARVMFEKQLISNQQMDAVRGALETMIAKVTESERVTAWKTELENLDKLIVPKNKSGKKGSPIIQQILFKKLETQLKIAHAQKGVISLDRQMETVNLQLQSFMAKRGELASLEDDIEVINAERLSLESIAAMLRKLATMGPTEFTVVSPAKVGDFPISSNRKKIFMGLVIACMAMCCTTIAGFDVLFCGIIPTDAQIGIIGLPIIAEISHDDEEDDDWYGYVEYDEDDEIEEVPVRDCDKPTRKRHIRSIRLMALQLRQRMPLPGAVFLLSSVDAPPRLPEFIGDLAECLADRDERVLIVDARPFRDGLGDLAGLVHNDEIARQATMAGDPDRPITDEMELYGLRHWLAFQRDRIDDIVLATNLPAVDLILPGKSDNDEVIATIRMSVIIESLRERYSMILLIGHDIISAAELQVLSAHADGIAFAFCDKSRIKNGTRTSIAGLKSIEAPMFGAIHLEDGEMVE